MYARIVLSVDQWNCLDKDYIVAVPLFYSSRLLLIKNTQCNNVLTGIILYEKNSKRK